MNYEYVVPHELRSKTQVWKIINLSDLAFCIFFFCAAGMLSKYVSSSVSFFYWVWNFVVCVFCCIPAKGNKNKKTWQAIVLMLISDKKVYHSIESEEKRNVKISFK